MPSPLELLLQRERERVRGGTPAAAAVAEPEPIEVPEDPETSSLAPRNQGAFLSALNWLGRGNQVVKNVITGNTEGALRQAADFVLDPIDAVIPFMDAIPEISRSQDYVEGADLVGIDRENDPVAGTVASLGVDIATDPLTYLGFGPLIQGAKAGLKGASALAKQLPKGAEAVEAIQKGAKTLGEKTRSVFGEQRLSPEAAAAVDAKKSTQSAVRTAAIAEARRIAEGLTQAERKVAGEIADGVLTDDNMRPIAELAGSTLDERLAAHPLAATVRPDAVLKAVDEAKAFGRREYDEAVSGRALADLGGIKDYIPRKYIGLTEEAKKADALGRGTGGAASLNPLSERSLDTPKKILEYFSKNPDLKYVSDLGERLIGRAQDQSAMMGRASLSQAVLNSVRSGAVKLPDDVLESYATAPTKGPVGEAYQAVDLGGGVAKADDLFSLNVQSGKALPPATPPIAQAADPFALNTQSGKSLPPATAPVGGRSADALDAYGVSPGSGKAVVGPSAASSPLDLLAPYGVLGGGKAVVGPSAASAPLDLLSPYGVLGGGKAVVPGVKQTTERAGDALAQYGIGGSFSKAERGFRNVEKIMDDFNLTDPESRRLVVDSIKAMDPESSRVVLDAFQGLPPRGPFLETLAKVNRVVKPMMVYGYAIPKVGSIVRNKIGGAWSAISNKESREVAIPQLRRFFSDLYGAVHDSLGLSIGKDKLGKALAAISDTTTQSGGIAKRTAESLASGSGAGGFSGQQLADLFHSGVLDGFVSSENMLSEMARTGWKKKFQSIVEWPARMFRGVEDRMRAGMYLDLINKGKKSADASRITRESLFDYDISSVGNRTARDLIPFFQFSAKAIPQQAKFLAEKPFVAVGLASLLTEREGEPKPPWLEGRLAIPLGSNEEGGRNYLAGTGLPFEALASIPNPSGSIKQFGRDVGRSIVGAGQPVLKTGLAAAFGVDPYFGTPFGTYSKLPGDIDAGAAGRAINILRQTGITQPLESLAGTIGKAVDSRKSGGEKALDLLTGANVVSVDPDRALQQRLTEYLRNNPNIASVWTLYANTDDPEALALIKELNGTKARLREKRKAAESLNSLAQ